MARSLSFFDDSQALYSLDFLLHNFFRSEVIQGLSLILEREILVRGNAESKDEFIASMLIKNNHSLYQHHYLIMVLMMVMANDGKAQ